MGIFTSDSFDAHEQVVVVSHAPSGLRAIVAVHSTAMGPALGGCRMWPYLSEQAAIEDVLRLSKGMSYKNALAGIPFGGGKAVIIGDSKTQKSEALLQAFAERINWLGGRYITAEDMGITEQDADFMATISSHVGGLSAKQKGGSGNPSPKTAYGTYLAIKKAVAVRLNTESLKNLPIAVQGLGAVGMELCRLLRADDALVYATDVNAKAIGEAVAMLGVIAVPTQEIIALPVAVFAPCAMGGIINDETVGAIEAKVVAGAANNQLQKDIHGQALFDRQILYAPDYVVNAGGVINIAGEILKETQSDYALKKIERIPSTLSDIFAESLKSGTGTNFVANAMAERLIDGHRVPEAA